MLIKLPKTFQLHGQTYKVQHSRAPKGETPESVAEYAGLSNRYKGLCWVSTDGHPDSQERVFYHELTHLILFHLGQNKANKDEKFVDGFASLLHQFLKTRKY